MSVRLDIRGHDEYGRFTCSTKKRCGCCGCDGELTLKYSEVDQVFAALRAEEDSRSTEATLESLLLHRLRAGVNVEHTILKHAYVGQPFSQAGYIGITCGCYAKFQRQVAHIVDSMKARGTLPTDG